MNEIGRSRMPDEPVSHIARPSVPWRPDGERTECGKPSSEFASVVSAQEAEALVRKHGKTRAMFLLCVTCVQTASRHAAWGPRSIEGYSWDSDPIEVLARYIERARYRDDGDQVRVELRAVGMLVEAHIGEFDGLVAGLVDAPDLARARARRAAQRNRG